MIASWLTSRRSDIRSLIQEYVEIPTASPLEENAGPFLQTLMSSIGYELTRTGDWQAARNHPDWSPHPAGQVPNASWVASPAGSADDRPEIFVNAHVDVVPPAP